MNFLAHIHIADHCDSDIAGNLLGDFVKGNPEALYSAPLVSGIRLHRFVDRYTDSHHVMKQARLCFPQELRRYAPIALDVFWDHCLATRWREYHQMSLSEFCCYAESEAKKVQEVLPQRYQLVTDKMWQGRWIESYREMENIELALSRMSMRSERMVPLAQCYPVLAEQYHEISALFPYLYVDVLEAALEFSGS